MCRQTKQLEIQATIKLLGKNFGGTKQCNKTPQHEKYLKPGNPNGEAVIDAQDPLKKAHPVASL